MDAFEAAEHRIRAEIAADIRAQKTVCRVYSHDRLPKPSCCTCGRNGAFERAASIAEDVGGSSRDEVS